MYYYKVFGYIFRCRHEIKQLYEVPATEIFDVDIIIGEMPEEVMEAVRHADIFPCIAWNGERFWMNNAYGILAVYKSGEIYAKSISDKDTFYLLQFVLGYGIAMYAHLNNRIAIHCGSVAIDDKCVMISGDSGAGKSTLTHELISDGALMLSDDVVAIGYDENGEVLVYPAFPQQKLCRNAALEKGFDLDELLYVDPEKDKFAVLHAESFTPKPYKLHSLYYLQCYEPKPESADTVRTTPAALRTKQLDGFNKVAVLIENLYLGCLIPNTGLSAEAFQLCVDCIKSANVYFIKRPAGVNTLPEIKQFIHDTLNQ